MDNTDIDKKNEIRTLQIPRWEEMPNIDLCIDQVVTLLENYLSNFIKSD